MVDTNTPPQHLQFNGLIDLPFGRGKRWLGGVNKPLNEAGRRLAACRCGQFTVTDFAITTTNWGPTSKLSKLQEIRADHRLHQRQCLKEYEWFNGYIAPTALSGNTCSRGAESTVVSSLPTSWASYQAPLDTPAARPLAARLRPQTSTTGTTTSP